MSANVLDFGAAGNGLEQDYLKILGAIQYLMTAREGRVRNGGRLHFPTGIYKINNTIGLGRHIGFVWQGEGWNNVNLGVTPIGGPWISPNLPYMGTVLLADSMTDNALLVTNGVGLQLENMSLWGRDSKVDGSLKTDIGVHCYWEGPGVAAGSTRLNDIGIIDFNVGVKCGLNQMTNNSDNLTLDQVRFKGCDIGFQCVNNQSLGHRLADVRFDSCGICIDMQAGGKMRCDALHMERSIDTMLRLGKQGNANEQMVFSKISFDATTANIPMLVQSTEHREATVIIDNIQVPKSMGGPADCMFDLKSRAKVIVRSAQYLTGTVAKFDGSEEMTEVHLEHCRFDLANTTFLHPDSTGLFRLIVKNCYDGHTPIPDFTITSESGQVLKIIHQNITQKSDIQIL